MRWQGADSRQETARTQVQGSYPVDLLLYSGDKLVDLALLYLLVSDLIGGARSLHRGERSSSQQLCGLAWLPQSLPQVPPVLNNTDLNEEGEQLSDGSCVTLLIPPHPLLHEQYFVKLQIEGGVVGLVQPNTHIR